MHTGHVVALAAVAAVVVGVVIFARAKSLGPSRNILTGNLTPMALAQIQRYSSARSGRGHF